MSDARIEILVKSRQLPDAEDWEGQRAAIRKSGACFDADSKDWRLVLDPGDGPRVATALSWLFHAARTYGTTVLVLDSEVGVPGLGGDLSGTAQPPGAGS